MDGVSVNKNGALDETGRIITWKVMLNPSGKQYAPDTTQVYFSDTLPAGLELDEDSIEVRIYWSAQGQSNPWTCALESDDNADGTKTIHTPEGVTITNGGGLSGTKYLITYRTRITDDGWNRITSSQSGSETFENEVVITTDGGDNFGASAEVTVTVEEFLEKRDLSPRILPDDFITYEVDVNPKGYALNLGQPLRLTDQLDTKFEILVDTICV